MVESAKVKKINALLGERYINLVSGRQYLLIREMSGLCTLEGIDRRVVDISREALDSIDSAWKRIV